LVNLGGFAASLGIGLNVVVHNVARRNPCHQQPQGPEPFDAAKLELARLVLRYGFAYAVVLDALNDVLHGTRELEVDGVVVRLPFIDQGTIENEAWKTAHGGLIDPDRPLDIALLELVTSPEGARMWGRIRSNTLFIGRTHMAYSVPADLEAFFAARSKRAVKNTDLPAGIRVGGYCLDEFRRFYCPVGCLPLLVSGHHAAGRWVRAARCRAMVVRVATRMPQPIQRSKPSIP
jgi:hypothetical protein